MDEGTYKSIRESLRRLYPEDERACLVGFSGGKDSTLVTSLVFSAVLPIPTKHRKKPIVILRIDTRAQAMAGAKPACGRSSWAKLVFKRLPARILTKKKNDRRGRL
jgi:NH3-dependent NAD+ synthetase